MEGVDILRPASTQFTEGVAQPSPGAGELFCDTSLGLQPGHGAPPSSVQSVSGEYNNPQGEELVMWIHDHTPKSAVFAGSMPTMATVLLTTGRPIVNHPHYESASLRCGGCGLPSHMTSLSLPHCRNRTKHVYTVFSRKPAPEIHAILHGMGVHYVICEDSWCRRTGYKPGE